MSFRCPLQYLKDWQQDYSRFLTESYAPVVDKAVSSAKQALVDTYGPSFTDPMASAIDNYIETHGGRLIRQISEGQYKAINTLVRQAALTDTLTVDELARCIRPCIGLTQSQAQRVNRFYEQLREDGYSKRDALKRQATFAAKVHRDRANLIAQTELAYAYNAGWDIVVRQNVESGVLPNDTKKVWSTAFDERVCDVCGRMDGESVLWHEPFSNGDMYPPAHPACRCSYTVEFSHILEAPPEGEAFDIPPDEQPQEIRPSSPVDDIQFDMDEYPPEAEQHVRDTLERLMEEYPLGEGTSISRICGTRQFLGLPLDMEDWEVDDYIDNNGWHGQLSGTGALYLPNRDDGTLVLGHTFFGFDQNQVQWTPMHEAFETIHENGWVQSALADQAGYGQEYILTHEYGHILASSVDMYGSGKNVHELVDWFNDAENRNRFRYEVSGYGTANWNEMFAEAFAQSFSPWQSESSKEIMGIYRRAQMAQQMSAYSEMGAQHIQWPEKGNPITSGEYNALRQYASDNHIRLQGFKRSDVDIHMAKNAIDALVRVAEEFPAIYGDQKHHLTLSLSEFYDSNDFAEVSPSAPHILSINQDAYRSAEALATEYGKLADNRFFVPGTGVDSIIYHEAGHIVSDVYGIDGMNIMKEVLNLDLEKDVLDYCEEYLSQYSSKNADEIISECFSAFYGLASPPQFVIDFMRKVRYNINKRRWKHDSVTLGDVLLAFKQRMVLHRQRER